MARKTRSTEVTGIPSMIAQRPPAHPPGDMADNVGVFAPDRGADVDRGPRRPAQAMQRRRLMMAEHRIGAAGEHRGPPAAVQRGPGMALGIDTAMDEKQPPALTHPADHRTRESQRRQLPSGDHTVLARGELEPGVCGLSSHMRHEPASPPAWPGALSQIKTECQLTATPSPQIGHERADQQQAGGPGAPVRAGAAHRDRRPRARLPGSFRPFRLSARWDRELLGREHIVRFRDAARIRRWHPPGRDAAPGRRRRARTRRQPTRRAADRRAAPGRGPERELVGRQHIVRPGAVGLAGRAPDAEFLGGEHVVAGPRLAEGLVRRSRSIIPDAAACATAALATSRRPPRGEGETYTVVLIISVTRTEIRIRPPASWYSFTYCL